MEHRAWSIGYGARREDEREGRDEGREQTTDDRGQKLDCRFYIVDFRHCIDIMRFTGLWSCSKGLGSAIDQGYL